MVSSSSGLSRTSSQASGSCCRTRTPSMWWAPRKHRWSCQNCGHGKNRSTNILFERTWMPPVNLAKSDVRLFRSRLISRTLRIWRRTATVIFIIIIVIMLAGDRLVSLSRSRFLKLLTLLQWWGTEVFGSRVNVLWCHYISSIPDWISNIKCI